MAKNSAPLGTRVGGACDAPPTPLGGHPVPRPPLEEDRGILSLLAVETLYLHAIIWYVNTNGIRRLTTVGSAAALGLYENMMLPMALVLLVNDDNSL